MEKFKKITDLLTKEDDELKLLGIGLALKEELTDNEIKELHVFMFKNISDFRLIKEDLRNKFFKDVQEFLKKYNTDAKFTSNN